MTNDLKMFQEEFGAFFVGIGGFFYHANSSVKEFSKVRRQKKIHRPQLMKRSVSFMVMLKLRAEPRIDQEG